MTSPRATTTSGSQHTGSHWSQDVTEHSDALDLEPGVFKQRSARKIAASLKHSAEQSKRRKGSPYQSAMSMLTFYINRAGHQLTDPQRRRLEAAKDELRTLFGEAPAAKPRKASKAGGA